MGVWDITTPAGSDPKSQGDDRIRELKAALQEALRGGTTDGLEAKFPGAAPSTAPVFHYRGLKGSAASRPVAGEYGLYFNTTTFTLQRDNDSTWEDIATLIPSGTVVPFFQATAPLAWTKITTQNDKVLRVVSGSSGGGAGGSIATSTGLAHSHTVNSHSHTVNIDTDSQAGHTTVQTSQPGLTNSTTGHTHNVNGSTGSTSPGTDSQLGVLAYADVIICSKD